LRKGLNDMNGEKENSAFQSYKSECTRKRRKRKLAGLAARYRPSQMQ
jgi:hypothetical protein